MQKHITMDQVESISLTLTTGVKKSINVTKLVTVDLVPVKPRCYVLNLA
jgi:hypothetical protein